MARQNDVWLYGGVADEPQIMKSETGEYIRGMFHLTCLKSIRKTGDHTEEKILFDYPLVLSNDPEQIKKMEKYRENDVLEIRGKYVVRKITKKSFCKHCGAINEAAGNINFIMPLVMKNRTINGPYTEKQVFRELESNREFSNSVIVVGGLCRDVSYFCEGNIQTSVYQIAIERRVLVKGDPPETKTDFPIIRSFGDNAYRDHLCLKTGSLVLVNGYLHTREFSRKTLCRICGEEYQWTDSTTEIIPYSEEYLANYTDPEEAKKAEAEKQSLEARALMDSLAN